MPTFRIWTLFASGGKEAVLAAIHPWWATTTRDKINLKWISILEEHMIEKCTVVVHDMAQNLGRIS